LEKKVFLNTDVRGCTLMHADSNKLSDLSERVIGSAVHHGQYACGWIPGNGL
jgi:hypothetical protein